jgi:hypothetical protein
MMFSSWVCSTCSISEIDGSHNRCPLCFTPRSRRLPSRQGSCSSILLPPPAILLPTPAAAAVVRTLQNRDGNVAGKTDPAETSSNKLPVRQGSGECGGSILLPPVAAPVARTFRNRDEKVAGKKDLAESSSNALPVRQGSGRGSTLLPPVAAPVARTYHNRDEKVAGKKDIAETSFNAPPARQGSGDGGSALSQVAAPIATRALHNQQQQQQQHTMLIRVRSNVGVWKIDGLSEATATVQDVLEAIAIQRPYVVYEKPLSTDAACATTLDTVKTLAEQGMCHGSMVHCRVDAETTADITLPVPPQSTVPVRHASGGDGSILSPVAAPAVRTLHTRDGNVDGKRDPAESSPNAGNKRQCVVRVSSTVVPRVGMDMRLRWDGRESLDAWLEATRPSRLSRSQCAWIQIDNVTESSLGFEKNNHFNCDRSAYVPVLNELKTIIDKGGKIPAAKKKACMDSLLATAVQQGCTVGKWMIFLKPAWADFVWEKIARATAAGHLGSSAKIAPTQALPEHEKVLCCIYVGDFSNRPEVKRVLLELEAMDLKIKCGFKPDIFTEFGIESKNQWRLPPTIYSPDEAKKWFSAEP